MNEDNRIASIVLISWSTLLASICKPFSEGSQRSEHFQDVLFYQHRNRTFSTFPHPKVAICLIFYLPCRNTGLPVERGKLILAHVFRDPELMHLQDNCARLSFPKLQSNKNYPSSYFVIVINAIASGIQTTQSIQKTQILYFA